VLEGDAGGIGRGRTTDDQIEVTEVVAESVGEGTAGDHRVAGIAQIFDFDEDLLE
jgi:hypothetical protein